MNDFYEILVNGIPEGLQVTEIINGRSWMGAELSDGSFGIAMNTEGESIERIFDTLVGLEARKAAEAVMSWNMKEASEAMAVINAYYNSEKRMNSLGARTEYKLMCTEGYPTSGKRIGIIGHLRFDNYAFSDAERVYTLERRDIKGDYPDSACEYILPDCDIVIITGSAAINKTLPRLIELSKNAVTIVIGPTVPLCPDLKSIGIDRISGLIITDKTGMKKWMTEEHGNPYPFGETFMI